MTEEKQIELLTELASAIKQVVGKDYEDPIVVDPGHVSQYSPHSLAWDPGPYEWTCITLEASLYAGAKGNYSLPLEPAIKQVLDKIKQAGGYLQAENHWAVSIYT